MTGDVIRELLVYLGVTSDTKELVEFDEAVERAKQNLADLVDFAKRAAAGIALVTGAAVANAVGVARQAEQVERGADALQTTTDKYQELLHVFNQADADVSDLHDALGTLTDRAEDAAAGTQSMVEDFGLVGLTIADLRDKNPVELFEAFADAVATTEDKNKALASTVRILGDDVGRKLYPILLLGREGLAELGLEAHQLGVVMDKEALESSDRFAKQTRVLGAVLQGVRNEIGVALMPLLTDVAVRITRWIRENRELMRQRLDRFVVRLRERLDEVKAALDRIDPLVKDIFGGWDGLLVALVKGAGMLGLIKLLTTLGSVALAAKGAVAALGVALGISFGWAGALVVGVLGGLILNFTALYLLIDDLLTYLRGGDSVIGRFIESFAESEGVLGSVARFLREFIGLNVELFGLLGDVGGAVLDTVAAFASMIVESKAFKTAVKAIGEFLYEWLVDPIADALDGLTSIVKFSRQLFQWARGDGERPTLGFGESAQAGVAGVVSGVSGMVSTVTGAVDNSRQVSTSSTSQTFSPTIIVEGGMLGVADALQTQARLAAATVFGGDR